MIEKVQIIILAAGKGVRMDNELPKVLIPLHGKPLISHILKSIKNSGVCDKPIIVVGQQRELVMKTLGDSYKYVIQEEQLGTGHAVMSAKEYLKNKTIPTMVLCGDHPLISSNTIKKLVNTHNNSNNILTLATTTLPDFNEWRSVFYKNFSRIVRDKNGNILKSVEYRDANEEERKIKEINPIFFCFNTKWLEENLNIIENINDQKEYYLTDLIKIAIDSKEQIGSINVDSHEALGTNSKEDLEVLKGLSL